MCDLSKETNSLYPLRVDFIALALVLALPVSTWACHFDSIFSIHNSHLAETMILSITTLPTEVFELILTYLDLDSVKALRRTERSLAARCLGPRFLGSLQDRPVLDVSLENLRIFHALACNPVLKERVRSITLLATSHGHFRLRDKSWGQLPFSLKEYSRGSMDRPYDHEKSHLDWLRRQQESRANESSKEMIELLRLAFSEFGELESITLDGAVYLGRAKRERDYRGEEYSLWMRASQVFSMVFTAIVQSGVSVQRFDAFRSSPRCCIPSGDITTCISSLAQNQLATLASGLVSFKLALTLDAKELYDMIGPKEKSEKKSKAASDQESCRIRGLTKRHVASEVFQAVLAGAADKSGAGVLLKFASSLRELDLYFRGADIPEVQTNTSYDLIFGSIAEETAFPMLEKCALSGFLAKGESILLFLQKHPNLRELTLHECHLTSGSWAFIFSHLEQSMPRLENVNFSGLYGKHMQDLKHAKAKYRLLWDNEPEGPQEVDGMVNLDPIWADDRITYETSFPGSKGTYVHTRSFNREELSKGLVFRPMRGGRGRALGSGDIRW